MELSTKLNEKIFIPEDDVFDQYTTISRLNACVTKNEQKSRIFLKPTFVSDRIKFDEKVDVLNLQLSAMFWTNWKRGTSFVLQTGKKSYRVCYATHNSCNEIRDFLTFIKPKKVNLNVLPLNNDQKQEMFNQIKSIQDQYVEKTSEIVNQVEPKKKFTFKRRGSNRQDSYKMKSFKKLEGS